MRRSVNYIITLTISISLFSCKEQEKVPLLEGTWELLSEMKIENGDTTFTPASKEQRMVKIINRTHFAFLRHAIGQDTLTPFVAGGGTYSLNGTTYKEHLEFFIDKDWENDDFEFTVDIRNDTLTQQGREKVDGSAIDRYIVEKYRRVVK